MPVLSQPQNTLSRFLGLLSPTTMVPLPCVSIYLSSQYFQVSHVQPSLPKHQSCPQRALFSSSSCSNGFSAASFPPSDTFHQFHWKQMQVLGAMFIHRFTFHINTHRISIGLSLCVLRLFSPPVAGIALVLFFDEFHPNVHLLASNLCCLAVHCICCSCCPSCCCAACCCVDTSQLSWFGRHSPSVLLSSSSLCSLLLRRHFSPRSVLLCLLLSLLLHSLSPLSLRHLPPICLSALLFLLFGHSGPALSPLSRPFRHTFGILLQSFHWLLPLFLVLISDSHFLYFLHRDFFKVFFTPLELVTPLCSVAHCHLPQFVHRVCPFAEFCPRLQLCGRSTATASSPAASVA